VGTAAAAAAAVLAAAMAAVGAAAVMVAAAAVEAADGVMTARTTGGIKAAMAVAWVTKQVPLPTMCLSTPEPEGSLS
jgi:hypothetical protein